MFQTAPALFLTALITSATALSAQETAPAADEPAVGTPAVPTEELSLGEPAGPQLGQPYILEESGDWAVRCIKSNDEFDPCQLYQLLDDSAGNSVAEISMFPLPAENQASAAVTVVAPLETLLTQQLTLSVDGGRAVRYQFSFCNEAGCVARFGFTEEQLTRFRRGSKGTLRMVPAAAPDQEVRLEVSLTGFTAGYAALQETRN